MKKVLSYIRDYYLQQNLWHFLAVTIFAAAGIFLNYKINLENSLIDAHYGSIKHGFYYFLLYSVATIPVYLSYAYDKEAREKMLSQPRFWGRLLLALVIFSIYCYFYQYRDWIRNWTDFYKYYYWKTCADQFFQATLMFCLIFIFWLIRDRTEQNLYGLKLKGVDVSPYLWMLALMVPLIVGASFFSSFTEYYPTFRRFVPLHSEMQPAWLYVFFYEFCYGSEFFHIEFYFRGFLILAFVRYAGYRAILPAAVFYCFVHFGKPMGECISSYFGGLILGILSYRTGSIAAGVFVHIGIAWLMELIAAIFLLQQPDFQLVSPF